MKYFVIGGSENHLSGCFLAFCPKILGRRGATKGILLCYKCRLSGGYTQTVLAVIPKDLEPFVFTGGRDARTSSSWATWWNFHYFFLLVTPQQSPYWLNSSLKLDHEAASLAPLGSAIVTRKNAPFIFAFYFAALLNSASGSTEIRAFYLHWRSTLCHQRSSFAQLIFWFCVLQGK